MIKKFKNLKLKIKNYSKGFTLIELLIVIAIIGILSSLLMANFIGVRQRARDAQRKADLRQIQSALELYRSDLGSYPSSLPSCNSQLDNGGSPATVYMKKIPCDPTGNGWNGASLGNSYAYALSGTDYILRACLENGSDGLADNPKRFCTNAPASYSLFTP